MPVSDPLFVLPPARLNEAILALPWRLPGAQPEDEGVISQALTAAAQKGEPPTEHLPGFSPPFRIGEGPWDAIAVAKSALSPPPPQVVPTGYKPPMEWALDLLVARLLRGSAIDQLRPLGGQCVPGVGVRARIAYGIDDLPKGGRGLDIWRASYWRRSALAALVYRGGGENAHWALHIQAREVANLCAGWPSDMDAMITVGPYGRRWTSVQASAPAEVLRDLAAGARIWPPIPGTDANQIARPDPDTEAQVLNDWTSIERLGAKARRVETPILPMEKIQWEDESAERKE
jgi:hypothetical protein